MELYNFNEWWRSKEVPKVLIGKKRDALKDILELIPRRQIILIEGLRRVGKTTLMFQIIDHLISRGVSPYNILYYTFDEEVNSIEEIVKEYRRIVLKENLREERIYMFFDEIQKLNNWWNRIKILYDLYPNIKFILSGSISTTIEMKGKESLAGRVFTYLLKPLDFKEFLRFREVDVDIDRIELFRDILDLELIRYVKTSGFIEIINEKDEFIKRYFKESIFDRIIFKDIPSSFNIDEPYLLYEIFTIISKNPGMIIRYSDLGNDLKRDRRTIEKYINYLESAFLVKKLFNYSKNELTRRKKDKKFYPSFPSFAYSLNGERKDFYGKLVENLIVSTLKVRFFFRASDREEIDIVYKVKDEIIPIEIKFRREIKKGDIRKVVKFLERFKLKKGVIISERKRERISVDNVFIYIIPVLDFLIKGL